MKKIFDTRKKRNYLSLVIVAVLLFSLILRVGYIQFFKGDYYKAKAESQQLSDTEISASRGTIYDSNMKILAQSASVWLAYMNPTEISDIEDEAEKQETIAIVKKGLTEILGLSEEKIDKYIAEDASYVLLKSEIENDVKDKLSDYISENEIGNIISFNPDVKRYYPYSTLASSVIGFTGTDGVGLAGLEYYYNDELTGVAGRKITTQDGTMNELPNQYETTYEAEDGLSLVLTLDSHVQYALESVLQQALEDTQASYLYGIVMDVDTGAILGMASLPDYDLNNPYEITDTRAIDEAMEEGNLSEDEIAELKSNARNAQWRNRAITDTYEPGSVFKVITASASLEEDIADLNTSFYCSGSINYATRTINCWKTGGHGAETFVDLLKNSCNPFAVTLADRLGRETFYKYFEAFGCTEKTGIDLPGEAAATEGVLYKSYDDFTYSDLASYSFGQSFKVSPIQMITAISAVANGGNLMKPYIVGKMLDSSGNTVSETTPTVKRQVISSDTASVIADAMEQVVSSGTGKNAYVAGYHVAGKTGTSEKLGSEDEKYVASFCGFAPADDPEIAVLIVVDEPVGAHGGGAVAAPIAGTLFEQLLPYLGVEPNYSDEELESLVSSAPDFTGCSVSEAKSKANDEDISYEIVGKGDTVVSQYPEAGRSMPMGGIIVLYTEDTGESSKVTVPDFSGMTVSQANYAALNSGLNIKISGSSTSNSNFIAYRQSTDAGVEVDKGEVITVYFKTEEGVND